ERVLAGQREVPCREIESALGKLVIYSVGQSAVEIDAGVGAENSVGARGASELTAGPGEGAIGSDVAGTVEGATGERRRATERQGAISGQRAARNIHAGSLGACGKSQRAARNVQSVRKRGAAGDGQRAGGEVKSGVAC